MKTLLKRALLSIAAFVALAFTMNAQQYQDVVYLKNGSVIHGIITEQIPNYCCPLKVSEQRDIHPQCCCNGIADDFSEGKPLS